MYFNKGFQEYLTGQNIVYLFLNFVVSVFICVWGLVFTKIMYRFPAHLILTLTVLYPILFVLVMIMQPFVYGFLSYFYLGTDFVSTFSVVIVSLICSMFGNWLKFGSVDAEMFRRFFSVTTLGGGR